MRSTRFQSHLGQPVDVRAWPCRDHLPDMVCCPACMIGAGSSAMTTRSRYLLASAVLLPAAWLLALICINEVLLNDMHWIQHADGSSSSTNHHPSSQYTAAVGGLMETSLRAQLGDISSFLNLGRLQRRLRAQDVTVPLGSLGLLTLTAHPSDMGLIASVIMPQLLLGLLIVEWLRTRRGFNSSSSQQHQGEAAAPPDTSPSQATASSSSGGDGVSSGGDGVSSSGSSSDRSLLVFTQASAGLPSSAAAWLALIKLLPMVCAWGSAWGPSWSGHPPSQLLQLQHPWTPFLLASITLLSQVITSIPALSSQHHHTPPAPRHHYCTTPPPPPLAGWLDTQLMHVRGRAYTMD